MLVTLDGLIHKPKNGHYRPWTDPVTVTVMTCPYRTKMVVSRAKPYNLDHLVSNKGAKDF